MKVAPGDRAKYAAELRKAKPVRRLTREEISQLEHKRNLEAYLRSGRLPRR